MPILLKRAYDPVGAADGLRVLVDRLWPRGLAKTAAHIDIWAKEVAPTTVLRQWFNHDVQRWAQFQQRYERELLGNPAVDVLAEAIRGRPVTLLYAAKDTQHNHALVVRAVLEAKL